MLVEILFLTSLSFAADPSAKTVEQVIPVTMANLRGHQNLYNEGWFLVTSSDKALSYAKEKGIESAGSAIQRFQESASQNNVARKENIESFKADSEQRVQKNQIAGKERQENIRKGTDEIQQSLAKEASDNASNAWKEFIYGNLSLVERTDEDRKELKNLPGNYFANLKNDYSNLKNITSSMTKSQVGPVENAWSAGFTKAAEEFDKEYVESGKQKNSIAALGNISWGYIKSLYHAVFAPTGKTFVSGINAGEDYFAKSLILVGGETISMVGRTVETVGLSVFYTGKLGYKVLSPTVESALLISLASIQKLSQPAVIAGGTSLGVMNQVAVHVVTPAASSVGTAAYSAAEAAKYGGLVTYNLLATSAEVTISEAQAGVVLGYNALTAIPTHLVLGAANTAFFLAWDGPRLVIAKVSGDLKSSSGEVSAGNLPVGTVVDLKKLKENPDVKVETIDESPEDIKKVLKELPRDL